MCACAAHASMLHGRLCLPCAWRSCKCLRCSCILAMQLRAAKACRTSRRPASIGRPFGAATAPLACWSRLESRPKLGLAIPTQEETTGIHGYIQLLTKKIRDTCYRSRTSLEPRHVSPCFFRYVHMPPDTSIIQSCPELPDMAAQNQACLDTS